MVTAGGNANQCGLTTITCVTSDQSTSSLTDKNQQKDSSVHSRNDYILPVLTHTPVPDSSRPVIALKLHPLSEGILKAFKGRIKLS